MGIIEKTNLIKEIEESTAAETRETSKRKTQPIKSSLKRPPTLKSNQRKDITTYEKTAENNRRILIKSLVTKSNTSSNNYLITKQFEIASKRICSNKDRARIISEVKIKIKIQIRRSLSILCCRILITLMIRREV